MKNNTITPILALIFSVSLYSCSSQLKDNTETTTPEVVQENPFSKNGITLIESTEDIPFHDAMIEMNLPSQNTQLNPGPIEFAFNVKNYVLGNQTPDATSKKCANAAKGQHIHLILNNEPYTAHYESQFNQELNEGNYVALAFLSRSYHMSIKHYEAFVLRQFSIGSPAEKSTFDEAAQHLFYSRPKGEYTGEDTKRIMLDFYLVNTALSPEGNKVKATINGTEFMISKWVPYFIEGLPMGENTFKLELINKEGNIIEGPFNTVERTITLSELN